ncbi:hypothetical protein BGZ96_004569 [Linnemannia gamsii]|uniref:RRM domain-containing protein n=1 Tax=Linnemannia gamsii TaxID=64522 RepID=A0ABQ7K6E2_9FUNG|nr:hypothetical protein BGZ96_004569 [Linnemannia gamsii]
MAARFLDMALDDVAKSRAANNRSPASRRGARGAGLGGAGAGSGRDSPSRSNRASPYSRNNTTNAEDRWTHDKFDESNQKATGGRGGQNNNNGGAATAGNKIIVENLHYAVTLEDIKELFTTHAGPVKFAEVKYDLSGRSTGVATITFKESKDAAAAIEKLHGIALDGQAMKIKYAPAPTSNNRQERRPTPSKDAGKRDVFSRLGSSEADIAARLGKMNPLPKTTGATGGRGQGASNQSNNNGGGRNSNNSNSRQKQAKPAQPREKKKPQVKTAEELDAEMDTYMGDGTTDV